MLVVPRAGSGMVNNMGATVIPGAGTVFRALATKGAWGFFDAPGGALISADGETVSLPLPVIIDTTTLKGDGAMSGTRLRSPVALALVACVCS